MKKILSVFLLCSMLILTGCEKKNQGNQGNPDSTQTSQGVVEIWTSLAPVHFEAVGREFARTQEVAAQFKVIGFEDDETLQEVLIDKMAEGKGPDIIVTDGNWIANNTNKLIPHEPSSTSNLTPELFKELFVQSSVETLIRGNTIFGLPVGIDTLAVYYNESHILDRLPNRNVPGKTWEEFREDVKKLTKSDNSLSRFASSGVAMGRFDNTRFGAEVLETLMLQWGVDFFDYPNYKTALFHQTQASENGQTINVGESALDFFTSFADSRFQNYAWNEYLANPDNEYQDLVPFLTGKTSMVFGTSSDLAYIETLISELKSQRQKPIDFENVAIAPMPQVKVGETASRSVIGKVYAMAIPRTAQYQNTAWGFAKFAAGKANQQAFFEQTKIASPLVELIPEQSQVEKLSVFAIQAKYAKANFMPFEKEDFHESLEEVVSSLNAKKQKLKGALGEPAATINNQMKRRLELEKRLK